MSKPIVLILGVYADADVAAMREVYDVRLLALAPDREAFLDEAAPQARALATRGEIGASAALIARCPKLEIISCYGVGYDAIDIATARARGIRVTNTPDVLTDDVADFALAMLLALLRKIPAGEAHLRSGAWAREGALPLGTSLRGKRVGILGLGRIGGAIARRLEGFGVTLAYSCRTPVSGVEHPYHPDALALARASDILISSVSGGEGTRGLVGKAALDALGPQGVFVNVSRGTVVDEEALISALAGRRIAGAALDVFLNEPNIDPRFLALDNVVLQPHQSSGTVETRRAMGQLVRDNLAAHFAGLPLPTPVL